ncbi:MULTISPECIES: 30S ribosomal protein S5 [Candidatus Nitrosocaldus]|uniref:Small ribosomal subunit protein uS5 n=1 Tax=Candidatus Nitrosocaldus cavascurensis TaxID=2058097 RepID=A0A2K5AP69_9ARCH|nr:MULTISPECIES: 30S ribosomal protein S5 [Candidatus Nitrosocaldus]SPC33435.1 30S ribosomal protein S5p [Candidatus Nitrosocaldus cavascurensis]
MGMHSDSRHTGREGVGRGGEGKDLEGWVPRTKVGVYVVNKQITTLEQVFEQGYRVREPEIVKMLLPDLKSEVVHVGVVQKQTDAGELTRFSAIVACGDEHGWFGIGRGKAAQMRLAIDKATRDAMLNIIPVKLGCGSWECRCNVQHSVPFKVVGKGGSVKIEIIPGPRGLGLVAGANITMMLRLAGIRDAWTRTFGSTSTMSSTALAVYNALRNTYSIG